MKTMKPFTKQNETMTSPQTIQQTIQQDTSTDTDESHRALRESNYCRTENGEQVTGYVAHWVRNYNNRTSGTDIHKLVYLSTRNISNAYIIERPNHPNSEIVITDL